MRRLQAERAAGGGPCRSWRSRLRPARTRAPAGRRSARAHEGGRARGQAAVRLKLQPCTGSTHLRADLGVHGRVDPLLGHVVEPPARQELRLRVAELRRLRRRAPPRSARHSREWDEREGCGESTFFAMKCSRWSLVSPSYATMYESTSNATPPPAAAAAAAPFVAGAAAAPSSTLMALDDAAMVRRIDLAARSPLAAVCWSPSVESRTPRPV